MFFIQTNHQIKTLFPFKNHSRFTSSKCVLNNGIQVFHIYTILCQLVPVVPYGHLRKSGCCFYSQIANSFCSGNYFGYFFCFGSECINVFSVELNGDIFSHTFEQFIKSHFNGLGKFIIHSWYFFQFFFHHLHQFIF